MIRRALPLVVLLLVSACGSSSPTQPSPPAQTPTRVIRLEGNMTFGNIDIGHSFEATLRIINSGTDQMNITGLTGPSGYSATWTSGNIAAGGSQAIGIRFSPTEHRSYNGTITVNGNHTSGTNTIAVSGMGLAPIFERSGSGDNVFDLPLYVSRVRIVGIYNGNSSNFILRIGGRLIVNELLGTGWGQTRYEGTLLTGGGGVVAITNSSGVAWSMTEVR